MTIGHALDRAVFLGEPVEGLVDWVLRDRDGRGLEEKAGLAGGWCNIVVLFEEKT